MIPSALTPQSIQRAIEQIEPEDVPKKRRSIHYDLLVDDKPYPPKYVIYVATQIATGATPKPRAFNAVEAINYFINRGYRIVDRRLKDGQTQKATDLDDAPPKRALTTTYRILRDTEIARRVKMMHDYRCQICKHTIQLADGSFYAEAHHIRPLGTPHDGPDLIGNIICVCPNHHAELDYGVMRLPMEIYAGTSSHVINKEFVDYHNDVIFKGSNKKID